jgi:hypothetical protein
MTRSAARPLLVSPAVFVPKGTTLVQLNTIAKVSHLATITLDGRPRERLVVVATLRSLCKLSHQEKQVHLSRVAALTIAAALSSHGISAFAWQSALHHGRRLRGRRPTLALSRPAAQRRRWRLSLRPDVTF